MLNAFSNGITASDILMTFPLLGLISLWAKNNSLSLKEKPEDKTEEFWQDLFLVFYSFIISTLISFVIQYSNVDLRGWWTFAFYYFSFVGIVYAFLFSLFAMLLKEHKKYTFFFSFLTIVIVTTVNMITYFYPLSRYAGDKTYYSLLGKVLIIHLFLCLTSYVLSKFNGKQ